MKIKQKVNTFLMFITNHIYWAMSIFIFAFFPIYISHTKQMGFLLTFPTCIFTYFHIFRYSFSSPSFVPLLKCLSSTFVPSFLNLDSTYVREPAMIVFLSLVYFTSHNDLAGHDVICPSLCLRSIEWVSSLHFLTHGFLRG